MQSIRTVNNNATQIQEKIQDEIIVDNEICYTCKIKYDSKLKIVNAKHRKLTNTFSHAMVNH